MLGMPRLEQKSHAKAHLSGDSRPRTAIILLSNAFLSCHLQFPRRVPAAGPIPVESAHVYQSPPDRIRSLLREVKTIAVVGLSQRRDRPSYQVARAIRASAYRIMPVRSAVSAGARRKGHRAACRTCPSRSISWMSFPQRPTMSARLVDECIALGVRRIWLQDGDRQRGSRRRACQSCRHHRSDGPLRLAGLPDFIHDQARLYQDAGPRQRLHVMIDAVRQPIAAQQRPVLAGRPPFRRRLRPFNWWSNRPDAGRRLPATASSTPTAARWSSAATAPAASPVSCSTRPHRQARDPRQDRKGVIPRPWMTDNRSPSTWRAGARRPPRCPFASDSDALGAAPRRGPGTGGGDNRGQRATPMRCRWWPTWTPPRWPSRAAHRASPALPGAGQCRLPAGGG